MEWVKHKWQLIILIPAQLSEDGKFVADPETGEFWSFFGGFAPLAKKPSSDDESQPEALPAKLFW